MRSIVYIKDSPTMRRQYLPFGETLVDEHQNSYNAPFKFNGKELDDEIEEGDSLIP